MTQAQDSLLAIHNSVNVMNERIVQDLYEKGWSVQPHYLGIGLQETLRQRLDGLEAQNALTKAGIGRHDNNKIAPNIRKDLTFWLDHEQAQDAVYLNLMEILRLALNKGLFLGLFEYEAHYAVYPAGGFYKKHIDALKGGKNRIVSTVCYLNDADWTGADGGKLNLYDMERTDELMHVVEPEGATLVVFLSEEIPHEVTPAHRTRRSIAGWFRCNASSADRPDPLV